MSEYQHHEFHNIEPPQDLDNYFFHRNQVNECVEWLADYKKNINDKSASIKKVLLIIGDIGSGKTQLAYLLLKKFGYQTVEYNSSDTRGQKKMSDTLKKTLGFKNVIDMFNDNNLPIGIIMDELDTIISSNSADKGGFNEFLDIIKMNDKYDNFMKKKRMKDAQKLSKPKKKTKKMLAAEAAAANQSSIQPSILSAFEAGNNNNNNNSSEEVITVNNDLLNDKYIKLYNPIICTLNNVYDKKINELKKYAKVVYLVEDMKPDFFIVIRNIYQKNGLFISDELIYEIIGICENDIRKLIQSLHDIFLLHYYMKKNDAKMNTENTENIENNTITIETINEYKKIDTSKNIDYQLIDATLKIFNAKNSIDMNFTLFDIDCLLMPLMVYHNSLYFIKNSKDDNRKKLGVYKNILHSICYHDIIQTNIFENQEWVDFYELASFYSSVLPNYYATTLIDYNKGFDIQLQNILNKISQMFVNKKLVSYVKNNLIKINIDVDEIIYLVEIVLNYFDVVMNDFKDMKCSKKDLLQSELDDPDNLLNSCLDDSFQPRMLNTIIEEDDEEFMNNNKILNDIINDTFGDGDGNGNGNSNGDEDNYGNGDEDEDNYGDGDGDSDGDSNEIKKNGKNIKKNENGKGKGKGKGKNYELLLFMNRYKINLENLINLPQ